jgi:hypothetical protein
MKAAKPSQKTVTTLARGTRVVHAHRGDNFKLSGSCQKGNHQSCRFLNPVYCQLHDGTIRYRGGDRSAVDCQYLLEA